ncbi:MAG TPA: 4Fe-4S binding protein, partial [Xanthobacteraceae bacterium]|nr:4Fe-4S binding protein [Xanthobacteraceae bacterium]
MPLDEAAIARGCKGAKVTTARHLCRAEVDRFQAELAGGQPITVGCMQEAPLFGEIAAEAAADADIRYVNIRETAGWSNDAAAAGPKMAALIAAAAEPLPDFPLVSLESDGVALIYGRDERAIEAAQLLKDRLDVTVMISKPVDISPPRITEFPIVKGTVRNAKGWLGAFEVTVDNFAQPLPSSRDKFVWASARDGATSNCDIVVDLSGGTPLFPAHDLRDGYVRADPGDPQAVLRAVLKAGELVGTFDKPRYIKFTEHLCAHSRSKKTGCTRCLDLCPTGAIEPNGDHVRIDENICAGCGACASVCPTGAASYALPPADALMRKLRTLLTTYREAGGRNAVVLLHDAAHGEPMIDALARHGDGLPANVLPIAVNEVTQVGLETVAAAFAFGASAVRFLLRAKPQHDPEALLRTLRFAEPILAGLGFGTGRAATIETDDPDALGAALRAVDDGVTAKTLASFQPIGAKRDVMKLALRELQRTAPAPVDVIALPAGAPFGKVEVNVEGCTLCLSCVAACPTGALIDDPERPMLRFQEDACVQCGLCKATCPEKVISLVPQIDFTAVTAPARVVKQEEPFHCISCGKPFGTKSTIERVSAKLEGKHWMFKGQPQRLDVLKMCEDCRVVAMTNQSVDPYAGP